VVCALIGRSRRERGCVTPGDDRLETRAYAVKRYLFRLGHAARSARYATSIEQLVVGLAPVMGWGKAPAGPARARFVRAHRKSVQRWLDDLQLGGLVSHEPERDRAGRWWRTQIVLLMAPEPSDDELRIAGSRAKAWQARERARRSRRGKVSALAAIRRRGRAPKPATRARLARRRAQRWHEAKRRAEVEATIRRSADRAGLLTHPVGAPPSSAGSSVRPRSERYGREVGVLGSAASRSAQALQVTQPLAVETGARARPSISPGLGLASSERNCGIDEIRPGSDGWLPGRNAWLANHDAAVRRRDLLGAHVTARVQEVLVWPAGRPCPVGRIAEAWLAHRYGVVFVIERGSGGARPRSAAITRRLQYAVELYETFASERPPGWPESGPAALCGLARQERAATLAGDVARLLILGKAMRAATRLEDRERTARAARRIQARSEVRDQRFSYRRSAALQETAEQRRRRVRDALLLSGGDPASWPNADLALDHLPQLSVMSATRIVGPTECSELDGVGARAARYRRELETGRWTLPAGWTAQPLNPQEDTRDDTTT
jgi:hypothetical protein